MDQKKIKQCCNKQITNTHRFAVFIFLILLVWISVLFPDRNSGTEKNKVDMLNRLAGNYLDRAPQKTIDTGRQALTLARDIHYPRGEAEALWYLSWAYYNRRLGKKALEYGNQALAIFEKTGNKEEIARTHNHLGVVYFYSNKFFQALEHYKKAQELIQGTGNNQRIAEANINIARVYTKIGQLNKAIQYHREALEILEKTDNKRAISSAYSGIGRIYQYAKNPKKALEYYKKAVKCDEETGDQSSLADGFIDIGMLYRDARKYKTTLEYFSKTLTIRKTIGDKKGTAHVLNHIARVYDLQKKYDKALDFHKQALKIRLELDDGWGISYSYLSIGVAYYEQGYYDKALEYLKKCYFRARGIVGAEEVINRLYRHFSKVYTAKKEYKEALDSFQLFYKSDKKLMNKELREQINQLEFKYETEKKEKEIQGLKKDKEIQNLRLSRTMLTRNAFIAGFIFISIFLALLFKKYLYLFTFWKKQKYVGNFRLMDKLGSGAMGTVYKAHSILDKSQMAAVKILKEELFTDETSKRRFKREAAIIDKLQHPNIVEIFERGQAGQTLYIAMEFLEGKPLDRKIREEGPFSLNRCLHIMLQVTRALVMVHRQNIIHRDLKPANIMVLKKDNDPDFVKLLDFGLAKMDFQSKLTQSGIFVGTLEYISPEQLLDGDTSPANDVFSLGVTFYRLLCNISPFPGESPIDIMRQIIKGAPPPPSHYRPDIPEPLDGLIKQMMNKKPGKRPPVNSILEVLKNLE